MPDGPNLRKTGFFASYFGPNWSEIFPKKSGERFMRFLSVGSGSGQDWSELVKNSPWLPLVPPRRKKTFQLLCPLRTRPASTSLGEILPAMKLGEIKSSPPQQEKIVRIPLNDAEIFITDLTRLEAIPTHNVKNAR
jgi:hypothetical protein